MATRMTVSVSFGEVRCIGVNAEDHVGSVKLYCCIGMGGKVIKELFAFIHCCFGAFGLFTCNCAERHEDGEINSLRIIEDAPDDTLDLLDVLF